MATRTMVIRKRLLIILGAATLALAVALSAFFFGGPRPGSAAPAGIGPAIVAPVARGAQPRGWTTGTRPPRSPTSSAPASGRSPTPLSQNGHGECPKNSGTPAS
jgi:hypothetical protein